MNMKEGDEGAQVTTHYPDKPSIYEIRIVGHLEAHWSAWFEGLTVSQEPAGTTSIQGPFADQAALHGVLQKVRDLGLELVSVTRLTNMKGTKS